MSHLWAHTTSWSMAAARKVSAAPSMTRFPLVLQLPRELADGGGLAGAVDSHHHDHGGRLDLHAQPRLGGLEAGLEVVLEHHGELAGIADVPLLHHLLQVLHESGAGGDSHVGCDEDVFEGLPERFVDAPAEAEQVLDVVDESLAGLAQAVAQAAEEARGGDGPCESRDVLLQVADPLLEFLLEALHEPGARLVGRLIGWGVHGLVGWRGSDFDYRRGLDRCRRGRGPAVPGDSLRGRGALDLGSRGFRCGRCRHGGSRDLLGWRGLLLAPKALPEFLCKAVEHGGAPI